MRGFDELDLVKFFPKRVRVSDGTPFAGYVPLHNYASAWTEKPTEQEVRKAMKGAYAKTRRNSNLGMPNARWCEDEARRTGTGWELRYGFGIAEYVLNPQQEKMSGLKG